MVGRPREFNREEALARARDAFWVRGYEGTTMADLVEALGIASARIYAAFGSKEQLYREAIELYAATDGDFCARAFKAETTGRAALEAMLKEAVTLYTRRGRPSGCMIALSATNCGRDNEAVQEWLAGYRRERLLTIKSRIEAARANGELREDADVQIIADFYAAFLHGLSIQARDGVSRKRLLALIPSAIRMFDLFATDPMLPRPAAAL